MTDRQNVETTAVAVSRRRFVAGLAAAGATVGMGMPSAMAENASSFPSKPITIVVPFSASGTTDILDSLIAQKLTERWKVAVVVDNKLGAGGNIGTTHRVAKVSEHFSNRAHARTADTDEVDVFDLVFHLAISAQMFATSSVASGLARLRAFSAISSS